MWKIIMTLAVGMVLVGTGRTLAQAPAASQPAPGMAEAESPHSQALALVLATQQKAIREMEKQAGSLSMKGGEEGWWFDTTRRTWSVTRPIAPGIIDSTHMFIVRYEIDGHEVGAWSVDTLGKKVDLEPPAQPPAATAKMTARFLGTEAQWPNCGVTLTDIQGLYGGMSVQLEGTGQCLIRLVTRRTEKYFRFKLTAKESLAVRQACLDADFLAATIKARPGIPDEARPAITLWNAEGQQRQLAKWNDDKVAGFDQVYRALLDLRKKTEGAEADYDGPYRQDWQFPTGATQPISSKPVEKAGMQVTVTLPKKTFAADEQPKFTVSFQNVSDKALALNDLDWFWGWHTQLEDLARKGPWQLRLIAKVERGQSSPRTCAPGETVDVVVDLGKDAGWFDFEWKGEQAKPVPPLKQLQPGKYRLSVDIPLKEGLAGQGAAFWTGTITTDPVDFEVTGR